MHLLDFLLQSRLPPAESGVSRNARRRLSAALIIHGRYWLNSCFFLCCAGVQAKLLKTKIKQERELLRSCEAGSKRARVNALPADTET